MYDSADGVTGKTGLSPVVQIRKEGGSFITPSGAVSEVGNGYYEVAGDATDTSSLGSLVLTATASGANQGTQGWQVVGFDPFTALATPTNITAGTITTVGSISGITFPSNFSTLSIDGSGLVDFTQSAADRVWQTTARTITGGTITTYTGNTPQTGDAYAQVVLIPRRGGGSFIHTNVSTAATATVVIT